MSIHTDSGFTTSDAVIAAINVGTPENGISAYHESGASSFFIQYNSKNLIQLRYASGSGSSGFCVGGVYGDGTTHVIYANNGNSTWNFDKELVRPEGSSGYTQIKVTTTAKGLYLYYTIYNGSGTTYINAVWITIDRNGNAQYLVANDVRSNKYRQTLAYNLTIDKKIDYIPTINDTTSTSIANCCTAGDVGQYTVMDNLFFYVCRQYPNEGIIEMNGDLYYTDGTYLLLDGPMG